MVCSRPERWISMKIDAKDIVRGKKIKKTVIVIGRQRMSAKRRRLIRNGVLINTFDNRRADSGLET